MVLLLLAALYESWAIPFAVILAVPLGIFGALAGVFLRSYPYDVYTQIGIVTLIGLAAKNAILIVEFAQLRREEGKSIQEAAVEAAQRPSPSDPDDLLRVHPRRAAARDRDRGGRRGPARAGHGGVRRHDLGHRARDLHRADALRGDRAAGRGPEGRRGPDSGRRRDRADRMPDGRRRHPRRGPAEHGES